MVIQQWTKKQPVLSTCHHFFFVRKILQGSGSFHLSEVLQALTLGLLLQRFSWCGVLFIYLFTTEFVVFPPLSGAKEGWADDRAGCPELMTGPIFTSSFTFVLTWHLNAANEQELILLRTTQFLKRKTAHLAGNALTEGRAAGHTRTPSSGFGGRRGVVDSEGGGDQAVISRELLWGSPNHSRVYQQALVLRTQSAAPFSATPHWICTWPPAPFPTINSP